MCDHEQINFFEAISFIFKMGQCPSQNSVVFGTLCLHKAISNAFTYSALLSQGSLRLGDLTSVVSGGTQANRELEPDTGFNRGRTCELAELFLVEAGACGKCTSLTGKHPGWVMLEQLQREFLF